MGRYCFTTQIKTEHHLYTAVLAQDFLKDTLILKDLKQGQYDPLFCILNIFAWRGSLYVGYVLDGSWFTCKEINEQLKKHYNFYDIESLDHGWDTEPTEHGYKIIGAYYLRYLDDALKYLKQNRNKRFHGEQYYPERFFKEAGIRI